jgi:hypothetical protein
MFTLFIANNFPRGLFFIKLEFRRRIPFLSQVMFSVTLLLREERNDSALLKNQKEC